MSRKKEIESLRARILKLEKIEEKELKEKQALEETRDKIIQILDEADLSFESFIRFNLKTVRRILAKLDKEQETPSRPKTKTIKRKVTAKRRKKANRSKTTIKIPAGKYSNVPSAPDKVFEVKEKGPRPKALKSYAEEIGLDKFFEQCRIG